MPELYIASTAKKSWRMNIHFSSLLVGAVIALSSTAAQAEEIKRPFGLIWGESSERLRRKGS